MFLSIVIFAFFLYSCSSQGQDLPYAIANPLPRATLNQEVRIITQSCNYQYFHPNKLWSHMVASTPDLVTLLGDTVYLDAKPCDDEKENCESMWDLGCDAIDCDKATDLSCFNYCWSATNWYTDPVDEYNVLLNNSDFTLNKEYTGYDNWPVPVIAIWDDHDYCMDNTDTNCTYKNLTRDAYIYFMAQVDTTNSFTNDIAVLNADKTRGIYYYYDYNKTVYATNQNSSATVLKIRFYNFDVRWYRTKHDILGSVQREWFENLLLNSDISDIDYHIVCSGSTYYPTFGVGESFAEPWPTASKEWFKNITTIANIRKRLIILSGDVHYSAVYRDDYTFEIVTSAMTHGIYDTQASYLETVQDDDGYLASDIINTENIGILDLGIDKFSVLYINNEGEPIANFSYDYATDDISIGFMIHLNWNIIITIFFIFYFYL